MRFRIVSPKQLFVDDIKEVKNELANMKKELLSESNNFLTVEQVRDKLKVIRASKFNFLHGGFKFCKSLLFKNLCINLISKINS